MRRGAEVVENGVDGEPQRREVERVVAVAACNEDTDTCLVIPNHDACIAGDPCRTTLCAPVPGTPPGTGCVPGDHVCDDGIECTEDFCAADEFGQLRCANDDGPCEMP